jgi:hypothetical protein
MARIVAPLADWIVRGYSYLELQPDGERHTGVDLGIDPGAGRPNNADTGADSGDPNLGLPVVCFADGIVVARLEWDGHTLGFGNAALVAHNLFAPGTPPDSVHAGPSLWSFYAQLDAFADSLVEGAPIAAGDPIGTCGNSGGVRHPHLHFELRLKGPPEMPAGFRGGRLTPAAHSVRYADPLTALRFLEAIETLSRSADLTTQLAAAEASLAALQLDRDHTRRLKLEMESFIRQHEGKHRRIKHGALDALIARATA